MAGKIKLGLWWLLQYFCNGEGIANADMREIPQVETTLTTDRSTFQTFASWQLRALHRKLQAMTSSAWSTLQGDRECDGDEGECWTFLHLLFVASASEQ